MKPGPLTPTLLLAALAAPALAQPFAYDFAGTLADHFDPFIEAPAIASGQSAGVLAFDTGGAAPGGADYHVEAYLSNEFTPRYDQSWTVSVDLHLPLSLDAAFTPNDGLEQAVEVGIAVLFADDTGLFNSLVVSMESYHDNNPGAVLERGYHINVETGTGSGVNDSSLVPGAESARITLRYNANTHVVSASNGSGDAYLVNIGAGDNDFNMLDSDRFAIGLFTSVYNRPIPAATPATHDNFFADLVANPCAADLNADGFVDQGDIQSFIALFLDANLAVDFNGDGFIDQGDIQGFIAAFLAGC